jgi:hypothetical protein
MKRKQLALAISLALASPLSMAAVSDADFQALKDSVSALNKKLADVEQELAAEKAKNAQATAVAPASTAAAPAAVATAKPAPASWTDKVSLQGDLRLRYEKIDQEDSDDRNRDRIRARAAIIAKPQDDLELGFGLSTRQDADPVSANQTLGDGGSGKDIYLDLAYFDWTAMPGLKIAGGKIRNNQYRPGKNGLIWDADLNPEGASVTYVNGPFFTNLLGTWLESDSSDTQAYGAGGQLGVAWPVNDQVKLTVGAGYFDLNTQGKGAFYVVSGKAPKYYGNSVNSNGQYLYDYQELEGFANIDFKVLGLPASLFVDYVHNMDAEQNDSGYAVGAQLGVAKAKGTWEVSYTYEDLESDAVFGLWTDSDFGGGGTDVKGSVIRSAYALSDRTNMAFSYFLNENGMDVDKELDYNRLQLDLNFKY